MAMTYASFGSYSLIAPTTAESPCKNRHMHIKLLAWSLNYMKFPPKDMILICTKHSKIRKKTREKVRI